MNITKTSKRLKPWQVNNPFFILASGRFISQLGDKLYLIALPWLVLELTHSALQTSITLALEAVPMILIAPFIGVYVDRRPRKGIMVLTDIIRGVIVGSITLLAIYGTIEIFHIYAAALLLSLFTLMFDSASDGFIPSIIKKEQLVEANANLTFINTIMRLMGPALSGILIASIGAAGTIGFNAISFFLSAIILLFLPKDNIEQTEKRVKKIFSDIKEGFSYLFHHETIFPISVFSTFMNIGISMVTTLLIYNSKETLGHGANETAIILWVSGIFATITTRLIKPLKKVMTKGQMVRYGSLIVFIAVFILVINQSLISLTISYSLILMVGIIVNVNMMAYRQEVIPNHLIGRVMTSNSVLVSSFIPLSMILSGWLASHYSIVVSFGFAAVVIFINVIYAWTSSLKNIK